MEQGDIVKIISGSMEGCIAEVLGFEYKYSTWIKVLEWPPDRPKKIGTKINLYTHRLVLVDKNYMSDPNMAFRTRRKNDEY